MRVLLLNLGYDDYARRYEDYPPLAPALYGGLLSQWGVEWDFLDAARGSAARIYCGGDWLPGESHPWCSGVGGDGLRSHLYHYGLEAEVLARLLTDGDGVRGVMPLREYSQVVVTAGLSWGWPALVRGCRIVRDVATAGGLTGLIVLVGGPYPTLDPDDAVQRLLVPGYADGLVRGLGGDDLRAWLRIGSAAGTEAEAEAVAWERGVFPWADPGVAGERSLWTAAVLSTLGGAGVWQTGLDQPVYRTEVLEWREWWRRPVAAVVGELEQRIERGYRRFVWWDLAMVDGVDWYLGPIVEACWGLAATQRITTSHKLSWFTTTAIAPESVTRGAAWVLRRARCPVVRLRLDRYRGGKEVDEGTGIEACRMAMAWLLGVGFARHQVAVMVEAAYPGDRPAAVRRVLRRLVSVGLPPRLQAWAPIPGSPAWAQLSPAQRIGGGCSKWLPGAIGSERHGFDVAAWSRLGQYAYHARALLKLGLTV